MSNIRERGNSINAVVRLKGIEESKTFPVAAYPSKKAAKAAAEAWAAGVEHNILSSRHDTTANKTFGELLTEYQKRVTPTKRGSRWEEVRINMFLKDPIAQVNLRELNSTHFVEWRDRRLQEVSPATILRDWNVLSNALTIARKEWKWVSNNPMSDVKRPGVPEARDRVHTEEELERMMQSADYRKDSPLETKTQQAFAAYLLSSETALRAGEICALEWNEVFLDEGYLKVTGIKLGARKNKAAVRDIPLTTRAKEILEQFRLIRSEGEILQTNSVNLDALFRKIKKDAAIEGLHYHDSRHAAITMLSKHYDVLALARIVGHKKLNELMTYYNPKIQELVKAAP